MQKAKGKSSGRGGTPHTYAGWTETQWLLAIMEGRLKRDEVPQKILDKYCPFTSQAWRCVDEERQKVADGSERENFAVMCYERAGLRTDQAVILNMWEIWWHLLSGDSRGK